ncbi:uncharacterized protein LOC111336320 isoform X2 [Stylophora pistillata]|uniref:uncharacterized protein LOC111336320 isoform X2 n=1 Tax=Stylophora pistillata TaxID=50429 RepID=UPI000C03CF53|nr:uncharacterized protein LOC111336320 isoform X2 [Stylophora pistillata]
MEDIARKKFTYDHVSSYKARGKVGASDRNFRAQRASEKRHLSRMDAISKRRRMPLSPLADENVVDKCTTAGENGDELQDKPSKPQLSRREQLVKWQEERKLKKGSESQKKKSFVVRHVKHQEDAALYSIISVKKLNRGLTQPVKPDPCAANKPDKRVTRASARIATKESSKATNLKSNMVKKVEPKSKAAHNNKLKEKAKLSSDRTGRVTGQSVQMKSSSTGKNVAVSQFSEKAEPQNQVKTRSQVKKLQEKLTRSVKDTQQISLEGTKPEFTKLNLPAMENIKNTVSFGRGSSEGVERGVQNQGSELQLPSLAPKDFQFTAPGGINTFTYLSKTFKFQPLSPKSAAEFIFPTSASSFFSPNEGKSTEPMQTESTAWANPVAVCHMNSTHDEKEHGGQQMDDRKVEKCDSSNGQEDSHVDMKNGTASCPTDAKMIVNSQGQSTLVKEADDVSDLDSQQDASYFRDLVAKETDRLNEICSKWERINTDEENLSEEVTGQIRTVIGQAQLLIDQRFRQFSGLIDLSEDKTAEKQATASDLQGFWEMIYFQVEDVNAKFHALEKLKENNWQEEEMKTKKSLKKTKTKKLPANVGAKVDNKAAATRNRIQEMRMAMKAKMAEEKEKLRAEKRHQQEEAFVTILTPVKKSKRNDGSDEVVLTPVRRSIRKTPQLRVMAGNSTPVIVTTPKIISEDSTRLRLTPDNGIQPSEMVVTGTRMKLEEPSEESVCEMECKKEDDEMHCDFEQGKQEVLKSACKTTQDKPRKTPGKVTFQSPGHEITPACAAHERVGSPMETADEDNANSGESKAKRLTPRRFSARKCRSRSGTPYYQQRPRRRVSAIHEGDPRGTESTECSSSESDGEAKPTTQCPRSGLRRSLRRTPSKYRDSAPLETAIAGKTPEEISVKLFQTTEEPSASDSSKNGQEPDAFCRYLCPSSSDEEDIGKKPVDSVEHVDEIVFDDKEPKLEDADLGADVNLTPPDEPVTFLKPSITKSEPKSGRTPIHILRYLSDMDTPTPNSRQITPMPKTTIFVSPSENSKTPALGDSLGMMSPANVVRRFPASNDGSPLVTLTAVPGKEGSAGVTPRSQLAAFNLDSPARSEKRRDSVFFAPMSTSVVGAVDNLMSFSPVVEANESD